MKILRIAVITLIPLLFIVTNSLSLLYDADFLVNISTNPDQAAPIVSFVQFGTDLPSLTQSESDHMQDVRSLVIKTQLFFIALLAIVTTLLYFIWKDDKHLFFRRCESMLLRGSAIALGIIIALFVALLNFSSSFNTFHELFFKPGTFSFPPTSTLVTLFPEVFFQTTAFHVIIATTLQSIVIITLLWYDQLQMFAKFAKMRK